VKMRVLQGSTDVRTGPSTMLKTGSAGCGAGRVVTESATSEVSPTSEVGR